MTTLAYRDGVLAADSLATAGGIRDSEVLKVRKIGRLLTAGCGSGALCEKFVGWVQRGMPGNSPWEGSGADGNSLLVAPDRSLVVFGVNGPWRVDRPFYALGSGGDIALGAMAAGASAEEAVEIAIRFDVYSGGPIRSIRL